MLHRPFHLGSADDAADYNYDVTPRGSVSCVPLSPLVIDHCAKSRDHWIAQPPLITHRTLLTRKTGQRERFDPVQPQSSETSLSTSPRKRWSFDSSAEGAAAIGERKLGLTLETPYFSRCRDFHWQKRYVKRLIIVAERRPRRASCANVAETLAGRCDGAAVRPVPVSENRKQVYLIGRFKVAKAARRVSGDKTWTCTCAHVDDAHPWWLIINTAGLRGLLRTTLWRVNRTENAARARLWIPKITCKLNDSFSGWLRGEKSLFASAGFVDRDLSRGRK